MSDQPQGQGWWQASDGKWYPPQGPEQAPPPLWQPGAPEGPPPGYPSGYQYPTQTTNGYAIASLVLGILTLYGIGSILALIFGYKARREIAESGGRQKGRGLATAGVVLGWIGLALVAFAIVVIATSSN